MKKKHKTKLIIDTRSAGKIVVEEIVGEGSETDKVITNVTTSLSVSSFPIANFQLSPTSNHPNLISIKSGDRIEMQVCEYGHSYKKLFKGVFSSVTVHAKKEEIELTLKSVSEFYELQKKNISSQNFKIKTGLREILNEIIEKCGIVGQIEVDANIKNEFTLTPFKSFPALSLINAICYSLDLVYDFNKGDVMSFTKRSDLIHKMHNTKPTEISGDQIISSSFEQ